MGTQPLELSKSPPKLVGQREPTPRDGEPLTVQVQPLERSTIASDPDLSSEAQGRALQEPCRLLFHCESRGGGLKSTESGFSGCRHRLPPPNRFVNLPIQHICFLLFFVLVFLFFPGTNPKKLIQELDPHVKNLYHALSELAITYKAESCKPPPQRLKGTW